MQNIQILSEDVRNLIAAGEVVERPASVVKELVENSIDAGAAEIKIEVEDGGLKSIIVTDDGFGMAKEDIRLSIERHATSKIKSAVDLDNILTMGFRGEALPSIAQISKMTIESRTKNSETVPGHSLTVDGGKVVSFEEKGLPAGTRIRVDDLFYNVPARKKFAKTVRTEMGHIKDAVERLSLAHPNVRFQLISDSKNVLSAYSVSDQRQRASELFGSTVAKNSYECDESSGEIRLYGLVGDPKIAGEGGKGIYWFVNRRPVRDRILNHAINEAYRSLLPKGCLPFSVLYISMPSEFVDVNVHPAKSEVRFLKSSEVHDFVLDAVRKTLGSGSRKPEAGERRPEVENQRSEAGSHGSENLVHGLRYPASVQRNYREQIITAGPYSSLRPIGQFKNSYLLCERDDGTLIIIDQHAVHERIGYEKLRAGYKKSESAGQRLLIPETIDVPSKDAGYLEEVLGELNKMGWEIERFGGDTFCVKAVPVLLAGTDIRPVILSIAAELAEFSGSGSAEDRIDAILKITACHKQVRFGDRLTHDEIFHLLKEMDEYEWADRCPHGRAAVHEINADEIKKWFDR